MGRIVLFSVVAFVLLFVRIKPGKPKWPPVGGPTVAGRLIVWGIGFAWVGWLLAFVFNTNPEWWRVMWPVTQVANCGAAMVVAGVNVFRRAPLETRFRTQRLRIAVPFLLLGAFQVAVYVCAIWLGAGH